MTSLNVAQVLQHCIRGDGAFERAKRITKGVAALGRQSQIFATELYDPFSSELKAASQLESDSSQVVLFHSAGHNSFYGGVNLAPGTKRVLVRHYTPGAAYFSPYSTRYYRSIVGVNQYLSTVCDQFEFAIADGEVSRQELVALGFKRVELLPSLIAPKNLETLESDASFKNAFEQFSKEGGRIFLMSGMLSPDQRFEDGIRIFSWYQRFIWPKSRLVILGNFLLEDEYVSTLKDLIASLGLQNNVILQNRQDLRRVKAAYESANLFLCCSESELPQEDLLEAASFGVPIVASKTPWSGRFLPVQGPYFTGVDMPVIAELLALLLVEGALRREVLAWQRKWAVALTAERSDHVLASKLISFFD